MRHRRPRARASPAGAAKAAAAAKWDGKTTFECGGNDIVARNGITATAGVKAAGNCQLTMTGGSITASTSSVVASGSAKVDLVGTKVSGKSKTSAAAKVTGAP